MWWSRHAHVFNLLLYAHYVEHVNTLFIIHVFPIKLQIISVLYELTMDHNKKRSLNFMYSVYKKVYVV